MRTARIFGIGCLTLIIVFTMEAFPAITAMAIAGIILGAVLLGWILRPQGRYVTVPLAGQDRESPPLYFDGQAIGETYSQILIFRIDVRNLWLLAIPTVIPMTFLVWAFQKRPVNAFDEAWANISLMYWVSFAAVPIFVATYAWFRERWLLFRGMVVLGFVSEEMPFTGKTPFLRYEFLVPDGERYGGIYHWKLWSLEANGNVTPILVDRGDFNRHVPAVGLVFHKFVLVTRQHLPEMTPVETA